jgi:sporulation protein YlmC with PRC-barrel domain
MRNIASLTALCSAGSLLLSVVAWAQPAMEDKSYTPPPPAVTEPSVPPVQEAKEPAVVSQEATDPDAFKASDEQQVQRATEPAEESIPLATSKPTQEQTLVSSSAFIGTAVKNLQGEKLGNLQELMIDPQSGRVVYAVLASGGVLGMGEKSVAIPWETLKVGLEKDELIVEMDKDKLQSAPAYELSHR